MVSAHVQSAEALAAFRGEMVKFGESLVQAAGQARGQLHQTARWLEQEAGPHWQKQVRLRQDQVRQAQAAVNEKKLYPGVDGTKQSAIEAEAELTAAKRRLEEAERKLANVKRWRRDLEAAGREFQPVMARLEQVAEQTVPKATAHLDQLVASLEGYFAVQPTTTVDPAPEPDLSAEPDKENGV